MNACYEPLLLQLRMLADQNHDTRSLVAIAAQFERDIEDISDRIKHAVASRSHRRNAEGVS